MQGEFWIVNSDHTLTAFVAHVKKQFADHKYVTYRWRIGADRSLDQNALFHVWLTEFAAHLAKCITKDVTPPMLEQIKKDVKGWCYRESAWDFMVYEEASLLTGETKKGFTSSSSWGRGEMYNVLCWLQAFAAQYGCVLEAKGEFAKLKRDEAA